MRLSSICGLHGDCTEQFYFFFVVNCVALKTESLYRVEDDSDIIARHSRLNVRVRTLRVGTCVVGASLA